MHDETSRWLLTCCLAATVAVAALGSDAAADRPEPVPADVAGGTAARLFDGDATPLPGHVFLLIGPADPTSQAQVYDSIAYRHGQDSHPDTVASNVAANRMVRSITGSEVPVVGMTSASGGGPSGGLTRAIAYLNVASGGAFTGELRVAATGQLGPDGGLRGIDHIDAKTVAAELADVDVLFSPTLPSTEITDVHAARVVGEVVRDASSHGSLHDPARLDAFRRWGASRPAGMDVVDVRHLIDVSAYLCGSGSAFACQVTDAFERRARQQVAERTAAARSEHDRLRGRAVGDVGVGEGLVGQLQVVDRPGFRGA